MMNMVERVACSIYNEKTLDGLGDGVATQMMATAMNAIRAMRNPTPNMIAQTCVWTDDPNTDQLLLAQAATVSMKEDDARGLLASAEIVRDWQTMIDEALRDE